MRCLSQLDVTERDNDEKKEWKKNDEKNREAATRRPRELDEAERRRLEKDPAVSASFVLVVPIIKNV